MRDVSIRLEVHLHDDEVSGDVVDGTGVRHAFSGWLGLISQIDGLLLPPPPTP